MKHSIFQSFLSVKETNMQSFNSFPIQNAYKNPFKKLRDNVRFLQKSNREFVVDYWRIFSKVTSIHGIKYLSDGQAYLVDKLVE